MLIADENFIEDRAGLLCDGAIQPFWPSLEVLNQSLVSDCELSFFVTLVQSLNSPFFPPHIGAEPGRSKRRVQDNFFFLTARVQPLYGAGRKESSGTGLLLPLSILDFWSLRLSKTCPPRLGHIKVTEHSFQVPMLNSPLLLNYLWFGARFLRESRLTTKEFIRAFWLRCVLLPWQSSHESSLQDKSLCFNSVLKGTKKKRHFKSPRVLLEGLTPRVYHEGFAEDVQLNVSCRIIFSFLLLFWTCYSLFLGTAP